MTSTNKDFIQINNFSKDNFERAYLFVKSKEKTKENIFTFFQKFLKNSKKQEKFDSNNALKQLDIKYLEKDFIEKEVLITQEKDLKNRKEIETYLSIKENKDSSILNVIEFNGKYKIIFSEIKEMIDMLNKSVISINNHKINEENFDKIKSIINAIKANLQKINAKHLVLRMGFVENDLILKLNKINTKSEQLYFSYYIIQEILLLKTHLENIYQSIMEKDFDQIKEIYFYMKYYDLFYQKEDYNREEKGQDLMTIKEVEEEAENKKEVSINSLEEKKTNKILTCENIDCYKKQTSKIFKTFKSFYEKVKTDAIYNIFLNMTAEIQYSQKDVIGFFVKMLLIAFGLVYFLEEFDNIIFALLTIILAFSYLPPFVFLFTRNWFIELTEEERKEYENSIKELYDIEEVDLSIIKNRFELIHYLNKKIYLTELTK